MIVNVFSVSMVTYSFHANLETGFDIYLCYSTMLL